MCVNNVYERANNLNENLLPKMNKRYWVIEPLLLLTIVAFTLTKGKMCRSKKARAPSYYFS